MSSFIPFENVSAKFVRLLCQIQMRKILLIFINIAEFSGHRGIIWSLGYMLPWTNFLSSDVWTRTKWDVCQRLPSLYLVQFRPFANIGKFAPPALPTVFGFPLALWQMSRSIINPVCSRKLMTQQNVPNLKVDASFHHSFDGNTDVCIFYRLRKGLR